MKNLKLELHFAATAALCLAGAAAADVVYSGPVNFVCAVDIDGCYINVETGVFSNGPGSGVPGWDVNPYSTSGGMNFFNSTGGGQLRQTGQTTGPAGNIAAGTVIGSTGSYNTSTANVYATASAGWQYSATNMIGFRFVSSAGTTHYGWMRFQMGAQGSAGTAMTRTLVDYAYESIAGTSIVAGNTGGPPPAYDPCAATNPTIANGANSKAYRADAANASASCGTIYGANYYKFTPADAGQYTFQSCVAGAAVQLSVRSGCDASASELACGAPACGGLGSSAAVTLSAGVPVYVVVGGASASSGLTNTVSVAVTAPPIAACVNATVAAYGDNAFDTGIGNNGPQVVQNNLADTTTATIQKSLWYAFTPTATGQFAIKTCGSNGDTMLAIGTTCPGAGSRFNTIAFNDDAPLCSSGGTGNLASFINATNNGATGSFAGFPLTQDLVAGTTYYICLGQFSTTATTTVAGLLNITGPEGSACDGDFNNDGVRDGADLGTLLASFGFDAGGDMNGDGVTDGADLGALLAVFGTACP
ncbi:MAG: hypothetical protein KGR22_03410 [Planctomycetes bacterium]|nr:hypothetical protein [Planctomycetota bacterium]